jgi:hypothetical protein
MAPASLRNNYKAARGTRERRPITPGPGWAAENAGASPGDTVALPPLRPQNAESQDGTGRRPGTAPAHLLDPAATYNTVLTTLRSTLAR